MSDKASEKSVIAVFPGTFDPITEGHLDIIRRTAQIFCKVIVALGTNPEKKELFSKNERLELVRNQVREIENVDVADYEGLTIDFVRRVGGSVIVKGIRDSVDLRHELRQANTNRLAGGIETLFIMTSDEHALTASALIKQIAAMGGDVSSMVPKEVAEKLRERLVKPSVDATVAETGE